LLERHLRLAFVARVVLGQVAILPFVIAGVAVLGWGVEGLYWLVAGVVLTFLVAVPTRGLYSSRYTGERDHGYTPIPPSGLEGSFPETGLLAYRFPGI